MTVEGLGNDEGYEDKVVVVFSDDEAFVSVRPVVSTCANRE